VSVVLGPRVTDVVQGYNQKAKILEVVTTANQDPLLSQSKEVIPETDNSPRPHPRH
jgi:hypothetical protein